MKDNDKRNLLIDYFKDNEKTSSNVKLGPEFEHIIVDRETYDSVSYYGENGVNAIFKKLVKNGWKPEYEGDNILALSKDGMFVTTEPGGQFEFSCTQQTNVSEIDCIYNKFFEELLPILDEYNYDILGIGYHPKTKINEIRLLPKFRYDSMFDYFKNHGTMGHNMMKGTAALQISIDFINEEDYIKKSLVTSVLSNAFYSLMENVFVFEGEITDAHNMRAKIWENTDSDRSGLINAVFKDDFSYGAYADYLLNTKSVFGYVDGKFEYTGEKLIKDLINENSTVEEIEHLMTMVFPDIRTKKFLEIRVADAVPYPLNMAYFALIKGLLYSEDNLNALYEKFKHISYDYMIKSRNEMFEKGQDTEFAGQTLYELQMDLLEMAKNGLDENEASYLKSLEEMLNRKTNPYGISKANYNGNIKDAVSWTKIDLGRK